MKQSIFIFVLIYLMGIVTGVLIGTNTNNNDNEIEQLESEISMLESDLDYYKKEATEMELYFEYLKDISRLNEQLVKEGLFIDYNGTGHYFEVETTITTVEFEVDYVQYHEDMIDYIELWERYNNNDFIISFDQFLELESPGLIERIEEYDDIYFALRD